jgi:DNA (cytosine-5)-methyltransferase 1
MHSWIRVERKKRNLSQSKLSQLTGIAQVYLSAWEHEKAEPNERQEQRILDAFAKFDSMVRSGEHVEFLKKTRWSKAYKNSRRTAAIRSVISLEEIESFVSSVDHSGRNPHVLPAVSKGAASFNGLALFCGCGGLALGFSQAGMRTIGHIEINESARKVFERNFPESLDLGHDITALDNARLKALRRRLPLVHVVFGGPPCQGFSLTGKRNVYDPRNQLYKDFARVVDAFRPHVFVLENVRLLTSMKTPSGSPLIEDFLDTFRELGYRVDYAQLNSLNFGVPQSRERVFFIGINGQVFPKAQITFPEATHSEIGPRLFSQQNEKPATLRDAIGDLEHLESGQRSPTDPLHFAVSHPSHVIEMLKNVPEGGSAHNNADPSLRPRSGYNTTYKRLQWDEPASTVSTTFGMISGSRNVHPVATRSLTIREAMRCQTFPDDFIIFGNLGEVRTMIGNAVPPKLAYALARHVIGEFLAAAANEVIKVPRL